VSWSASSRRVLGLAWPGPSISTAGAAFVVGTQGFFDDVEVMAAVGSCHEQASVGRLVNHVRELQRFSDDVGATSMREAG
jgi:hypothetical protein